MLDTCVMAEAPVAVNVPKPRWPQKQVSKATKPPQHADISGIRSAVFVDYGGREHRLRRIDHDFAA